MRTQWWRRGVGESWNSSNSRSLQKVSGIFEVRFLPWRGTISFFLHVCECHVLLVCPVFFWVWARLLFTHLEFTFNSLVKKLWKETKHLIQILRFYLNAAGPSPGVIFVLKIFFIFVILDHKCCVWFCIGSFNLLYCEKAKTRFGPEVLKLWGGLPWET